MASNAIAGVFAGLAKGIADGLEIRSKLELTRKEMELKQQQNDKENEFTAQKLAISERDSASKSKYYEQKSLTDDLVAKNTKRLLDSENVTTGIEDRLLTNISEANKNMVKLTEAKSKLQMEAANIDDPEQQTAIKTQIGAIDGALNDLDFQKNEARTKLSDFQTKQGRVSKERDYVSGLNNFADEVQLQGYIVDVLERLKSNPKAKQEFKAAAIQKLKALRNQPVAVPAEQLPEE